MIETFQKFETATRLHICAVAVSGSILFNYYLTKQFRLKLPCIIFFDWFIVNFLNRIEDIVEDTANGIEFPFQRYRSLVRRLGVFALLLSLILNYLFWKDLFHIRMFGHTLGVVYNFRLIPVFKIQPFRFEWARMKEVYFLKNIFSMFGFITTLFLYPLAVYDLHPSTSMNQVYALMTWFGLLEVSFEVIYDIRDYKGDLKAGIPTYPVIHGLAFAKTLVIFLDAASFTFMTACLGSGLLTYEHGVLNFGVVIHVGCFLYFCRAGFSQTHVVLLTWIYAFLQILHTSLILVFGPFRPLFTQTNHQIILTSAIINMAFAYLWFRDEIPKFWIIFATIGISACIAENSSIWMYEYYYYLPGWVVMLGYLPLSVTIIWPTLLLAEASFIRKLELPSHLHFPLAFSDILLQGFMVEVCCTSVHLWEWRDSNIWNVPAIGIIGWALFGAPVVTLCLRKEINPIALILIPNTILHAGLFFLWNVMGYKHIADFSLPPRVVHAAMAFYVFIASIVYKFELLPNIRKITIHSQVPRLVGFILLLFLWCGSGCDRDQTIFLSIYISFLFVLDAGFFAGGKASSAKRHLKAS